MQAYTPSSHSGSQHKLLAGLREMILVEAERTGNPWVKSSKLLTLYAEHYHDSPAHPSRITRDHVKQLLRHSPDFILYVTANPDVFFVKLQTEPDSYFYTPVQPFQVRDSSRNVREKKAQISPVKVELNSAQNLKTALKNIVMSLQDNHPNHTVEISAVNQAFYQYYHVPLKTMLRQFYPGLKLMDVIQ
ncbi:hypothetical protein K4A83_06945 [Spirulina subsalsa FACHB-351]|uniref:Uncharacterized protein n=1 Tax=Spirulina subsalsa FACHB-351 TaxID=234711 RepID=A0ABT3L4I1_9CYAN|nr:hypothetical protein [Spirulina subsalsa]MCW6036009.1 hypothetical protein [Spirulina subsalsa FACHB-351]